MSSQRGNVQRTRAQKHKNRHVFKNDLHDKTPQQIRLNNMNVSTVCQRCKDVIEWKIKYKKYKPLTQAKTCTRCQQRNVRKAYHVICRDCAIKDKVCAKCLKGGEEVTIEPTPQEQQQLQVEMDRLIKSFSERKRRAFLRYMDKGKKKTEEANEDGDENEGAAAPDGNEGDGPNLAETKVAKLRVPHTRDELLEKIKQLQLKGDNEDDDEDEWNLSTDDEDDEEEDESESDDDDDSEDNDEAATNAQEKSSLNAKHKNTT